MSQSDSLVDTQLATLQPRATLLWAEHGWRCFLMPWCVRLYSGNKRLLTHAVKDAAEGEQVADLWLRSIRRIDDIASQSATNGAAL